MCKIILSSILSFCLFLPMLAFGDIKVKSLEDVLEELKDPRLSLRVTRSKTHYRLAVEQSAWENIASKALEIYTKKILDKNFNDEKEIWSAFKACTRAFKDSFKAKIRQEKSFYADIKGEDWYKFISKSQKEELRRTYNGMIKLQKYQNKTFNSFLNASYKAAKFMRKEAKSRKVADAAIEKLESAGKNYIIKVHDINEAALEKPNSATSGIGINVNRT